MIRSLYIKDFALIDQLEISFGEGLNILTGQTGAGKSIIIGALNMILGERADTDVIRKGSDKAIAEGIVHAGEDGQIRAILEENEVEVRSDLILRREIRDTGSRAFINDSPVTIQVLKKVGDLLVDLHGQHDHQLLLRDDNHRLVVDDFQAVKGHLLLYQQGYQELVKLRRELSSLQKRENELKEKTELYQFQIRELEDASMSLEEEEELQAEMSLLDNAEDLERMAAAIVEIGQGEEVSLSDMLASLNEYLADLTKVEPAFESYRQEVDAARISIQEAVQFAERYRDKIEFNPGRLEKLRQRQSELNRLVKKYGKSVEELIAYLEEIRQEISLAENFDLEIEKLQKQVEKSAETLSGLASNLHNARLETGAQLSGDIQEALANLGIPNAEFRVEVSWLKNDKGWIVNEAGETVECTDHGCDDVRFHISTNRGEEPKPLARIASGGEISRVMLALKSIMVKSRQLPVMIFDEIDTGIGGHISEKVGREMRRLSSRCQIIAITHQPQIAGQAHHHYRVEKAERDGRTVTSINQLSDQEHIKEVAALMSGEEITESALLNAAELIERNRVTS